MGDSYSYEEISPKLQNKKEHVACTFFCNLSNQKSLLVKTKLFFKRLKSQL
jgi:hypothetical protein